MTSPLIKTVQPNKRAKKKVLYIVHNHPSVIPGGAEIHALELYEAMRQSDEYEPQLLSRRGPSSGGNRPGTRLSLVGQDTQQSFFFTDPAEIDFFYMSARDKSIYTIHFREFLETYRPDVIHIQHTLFLGFDLLRMIKNLLPATPIIYTLHEYIPICHRSGQMVRTINSENCMEESPRRCNQCFPEISPQDFFMRKRFIQAQFALVDLFLAPCHFLLDRFTDWGIPPEKIVFEDYGRALLPRAIEAPEAEKRSRNRFAFFGQINEFKGVDVLIKAMKILAESDDACDAHLWVHGANLEIQRIEFQNEFRELLAATSQNVTMAGRYRSEEVPKLMAKIDWVVVPSIWWENSPLVIQEAFHNRRPIVCSDIGGMAEKVRDGVDGLHFRARDPISLASVIRRATNTEGLWKNLQDGIPDVYKVDDQVTNLTAIYNSLIATKQSNAESYAE
ncbi:MAG TPA: glycosyltransferase family 4 protein [Pyrinomonadaceae bacterium]|nr:glycosyltransferase family 4 protein [Pyrinomonadaceae bacterium]